MNKRMKKVAIVSAIVAGALILGAILLGVANALFADGAWTLGWKDYRYDEDGYTVGDGSVHAERVTAIDLDWIDGKVLIVPCDDMFISLSESAEEELPETAQLRWRVDADGTLSVKHRKSQWFFGLGTNNEKELILRIPRKFFDGMQRMSIETESASVTLKDVFASTVEIKSENGNIHLEFNECPHSSNVKTENGKVTVLLSRNADVALTWQTEKGQLSYDLPITAENGRYVLGSGTNQIYVETKKGNLLLSAHP